MTTTIAEVWDALREAGASEAKSRPAAEALPAYDDKFAEVDRRFTEIDKRFDSLEVRIDQSRNDLDRKIDCVKSELDLKIERLDGRLNLVRWQLVLLIGGVIALVQKACFGTH